MCYIWNDNFFLKYLGLFFVLIVIVGGKIGFVLCICKEIVYLYVYWIFFLIGFLKYGY